MGGRGGERERRKGGGGGGERAVNQERELAFCLMQFVNTTATHEGSSREFVGSQSTGHSAGVVFSLHNCFPYHSISGASCSQSSGRLYIQNRVYFNFFQLKYANSFDSSSYVRNKALERKES